MIGHRSPEPGRPNATDEILEVQPLDLKPLKLWSVVPSILFIRKVRSEITTTSAWGLVVLTEAALTEAASGAGMVLFATGWANICNPANSRTGTSNRIKLSFPFVLTSMVSLRSLNFVPQISTYNVYCDRILQDEFPIEI
jgi:hypothetical protein